MAIDKVLYNCAIRPEPTDTSRKLNAAIDAMAQFVQMNDFHPEVQKRLVYIGRGIDATKEPHNWWNDLDSDTSTLMDRSSFRFMESDRGGEATFTTRFVSNVRSIQFEVGAPTIAAGEVKIGVSAGLTKVTLKEVATCEVTAETRSYVLARDNEMRSYHQYELDLCKFIARMLPLKQSEPSYIDPLSVSTNPRYKDVEKACFSFIKERQQTHYVNQITLGASFVGIKKHDSNETTISTRAHANLKSLVEMKLGANVEWKEENDFEDSCRRGTFTTSDGTIERYTVKRNTVEEAVFKVSTKPLDCLIKSPNLCKLLGAQLQRYCTPCK